MNWCGKCEKMESTSMLNIFGCSRMIIFKVILFLPIFAFAAPTITDVIAKQRFPWNGLVDISYKLVGDVSSTCPEFNSTELVVTMIDNATSQTWIAKSLSGDIGTSEGDHNIVWDLKADGIFVNLANVSFNVEYQKKWSDSKLYCVIDLSSGSKGNSFPVTYLNDIPENGWENEYKTSKMVLRLISPGSFQMCGSYNVTITKPYYIGVFEVTQKQFELVTGNNPSNWRGDSLPVERVSWSALRGDWSLHNWPTVTTVADNSFIGLIRNKSGLQIDLPTEAEWEYACRAGTTTTYNYGNDPNGDYMWYYDNSQSKTHEVGSRIPNQFGLFDMHGNVYERCLDWFGSLKSGVQDPVGPDSGVCRVIRGGSWNGLKNYCTSSVRLDFNDIDYNSDVGIRIAKTVPEDVKNRVVSICSCQSNTLFIDSNIEPVNTFVNISYNSSWIGGDSSATVVITDNGAEIYRGSGEGEFEWEPTTVGKHTLTYTTYINDVAQGEVLSATVYNGFKYEVINGQAVLTDVATTSGELIIPGTIDGYPVAINTFKPGLLQVKFDSEWDTISTLSDASNYDNVSGVIAAYHKAQESDCAFPDPLTGKSYSWNKSHTTFAYFGQMYMEAGKTYVFGEHFDDCASVNVDGNIVFSVISTSSKITTASYVCRETGWHDVEFRLGDNTGAKGSWGQSWTTDFGLGYRDDGGSSTTQSEWKRLLDPGDGTLLRCSDNNTTSFDNFVGITSVTLPASFLSSQSISSLFPKTFKTIENITLIGEINEIKPNTFAGCEALESITIPEGVISIGKSAFADCKNLESISIPVNVKSIAQDAFVGCTSLKNVVLPIEAFAIRNDLCAITQNGWIFSNGIYQSNDINDREATSMSLTIHGPYEFSFDWKVSCENSYDKLGWYLNDTLKNTISGTGSNWQKVTCSLPVGTHTIRWTYSKDSSQSSGEDCGWVKLPEMKSDPFVMSTLFPDAYNQITYVELIGESDRIPNNAFAGCDKLESVIIPDGISEIGEGAFADCTSLKSLTLPQSVESIVTDSKQLIDFDGAVAAYAFNGTLDDGTGYVPTGSGSFATDRFGSPNSAYYFNGQGQRFMDTKKSIETNFSFAFWFKTDVEMSSTGSSDKTGAGDGNYILFPKHGGEKRGYGAMVGTDGIKVMAHGDSYIAPVITYSSNIGSGWNHAVVVVENNTSIKLYLNGAEVASGTGPSATALFKVEAGGNYGYYTGFLDDLIVFDSAIGATKVANLYQWSCPVPTFTGCAALKDVTIPGALCSSMAEVFPYSDVSITNVTLTGNIAQIPAGAFAGCSALESVTLAQSGATIALGGEKGWQFDEEGVMRSGKIAHNESSTMNMTVQGEGRLTYRWKASSEYYSEYISDYAYLSIDDDAKGSCEDWTLEGYAIGGETDWQECTIDVVGDKPHEINWTFKKDFEDSGNVGDDCIWVDLIKYEPFIKVSFDIAGAEGTIPELIKEVCGGSINLPSAGGFAKAKHTFVGWSDGVQTHAPGAAYQVGAEDVVLTAVYEANTLAAPVISSSDVASGGSIETESATIEIAAGDGAAIYYTLDGTMPTSESLLYSGAFEADGLGLVTVKAIAVRDNCFDSEVSEFTFTRRPYSAAECLNANGLVFTLGGDAEWFRVFDGASHDGDAALRSGAILDGQSTYIETKVNGPGTISFWWKTSCEMEFKGKILDHISFIDRFNEVDTEKTYLTGDSGEWVQVTIDITGSGEHTLKWVYQKNNSGFDGEDCAWLDEVVWTPAPVETQTTVVPVPFAWLQEKYPSITDAAAFEAKANEVAANGVNKVWECYVAGIDPTDATAKFVTKIEMVDGKPVITWEPDMNDGTGKTGVRTYKILGSTDLKTWTEVADEAEADFNFFKVEVSMP